MKILLHNLLHKNQRLLIKLFFISVFIIPPNLTKAQTNLYAGDVAFTAYNSDNPGTDTFAIILLKGITSGTKIIFTDGQWTDATGYFQMAAATTDWLFEWEATADMNAFSQIKFWSGSTTQGTFPLASSGKINYGRALLFPTSGDQIFACQGSTSLDTTTNYRYTPTRVLSGIHMNYIVGTTTNGNWDNGAGPSTSSSELPDSLVTGTNAIWVVNVAGGAGSPVGEYDNAQYNCSVTSGTAATRRASINDVNNWNTDDGSNYSPALCSVLLPTNTTWDGSIWSNGAPTSTLDAIIASSTTPGGFTCKDLTINSGVALTLGSGISVAIYGDFTNNGNGTSGVGTLRFTKAGAQALAGTAFTHSGVVEIATGATLTTNDKLTLANGASLMHGTSTPNGGGTISGNVTLQKTIGSTTKGWRMFALPVDMLIDNFENGINTLCSNHTPAGERNVYYYDPTGSTPAPFGGLYAAGWTQANTTTDDENKAYSIYLDNTSAGIWDFSPTVSVTGTPNDGTKTYNLQYTYDPASAGSSSIQRGWNMIPNHFPSNLGVYNLINDANFGSTYKAIHVWNQGLKQMEGMNQSSLNTYNNSGMSIWSSIRQIPPFMGFWVKATSTSQAIQLKNNMRTSRTDSLPANSYFKKDFDIFRVAVKDKEGNLDQFSVCFDEAATESMDYTMDMYKFKSIDGSVPTLYTTINGPEGNEPLSLNAVPVKTSYSMPLYMESYTNGKEYTFSPITEEYSGYFDVELVDNKTGTKTMLLDNNYTFNHDADFKNNRFTLNFTKKATTSIDELYSHEKMYAYTSDKGINVVYNNNNQEAKALIEIYTIMGQQLYTSAPVSGGETISYLPADKGQVQVYIVKVTSNGKSKAIKVVY